MEDLDPEPLEEKYFWESIWEVFLKNFWEVFVKNWRKAFEASPADLGREAPEADFDQRGVSS